MSKNNRFLVFGILVGLWASTAVAQSTATPVIPGYLSPAGCYPGQTTCFIPFGVGFTATGSVTLSATTTTSNVALGSAGPTVVITNGGATTAYVALGGPSVAATTSSTPVLPGYPVILQTGSATYLAGVTASGTDTLTIVTGTGIPSSTTVSGGGGGGGNVTGNQSNASTGITGSTNIGSNGYNYGWDGTFWRQINASLYSGAYYMGVFDPQVLSAVNSPTPAGTNIIGKFGIDQTTPGTTNGVQTLSGSTTTITGTVTTSGVSVTPIASTSSTITTGGTAVTMITGPVKGCYITNPTSATDQGIATAENAYVNPVATATTTGNGTNATLAPGQSFYCPTGMTTNVSVNAATSSHKLTVVQW